MEEVKLDENGYAVTPDDDDDDDEDKDEVMFSTQKCIPFLHTKNNKAKSFFLL